MKKRIIEFMKKQWLLLWLLLSFSLLFGTLVALAEYPGTNNFMKRVVLSDDSTDMMFSSNLLTLYDNNRVSYQPCYVRQLTDNDVASTYDIDVYVWNYDINGSGIYYSKEIEYDLEISVVDAQGNVITGLDAGKTIQIVKNDSATAMVTFNSTSGSYTYNANHLQPQEVLVTNKRDQSKYTIKFSKNWDLRNDVNKRVLIKAIPTSDFPELKPLAASIGLREEMTSSSNGWKYYINEQKLSSNSVPTGYDGYNLILTGTGSETIEIEWDPTKVALNKDFYESNGAFDFASGEVTFTSSGGTNGWNKLVIAADSYSQAKGFRNRYGIQFYKVDGEISSAWDFVADAQDTGIYITINIPTDTEE